MKRALSNTALARKMLISFWSDCQPHSVQEFKAYLQENNMETVGNTHIQSAIYTATSQEVLNRISRAIYQAGKNLNEIRDLSDRKTNGMKSVLRRVKSILSSPVNVTAISPKERELIPKLQELYQECENLLNELESEGGCDEISE